jgi:hypothetical protein
MDGRGIEVRFLEEAIDFQFSIMSRPALNPTQPPIQWIAGAVFPGIKRQGHEADHSLPSSAEAKKGGAIPPLSHINEMGR